MNNVPYCGICYSQEHEDTLYAWLSSKMFWHMATDKNSKHYDPALSKALGTAKKTIVEQLGEPKPKKQKPNPEKETTAELQRQLKALQKQVGAPAAGDEDEEENDHDGEADEESAD